jgi:hypothetical protein
LSVDIVAISMVTPFARFFSSDDRSAWGVLRFHRGLRDNLTRNSLVAITCYFKSFAGCFSATC